MKRYIFCYDKYPLGQITFDEERGKGEFFYTFTSSASENVAVKPETTIMLLEEIRYDAMDIKTIGEFERYVKTGVGKFHFVPMKGYE